MNNPRFEVLDGTAVVREWDTSRTIWDGIRGVSGVFFWAIVGFFWLFIRLILQIVVGFINLILNTKIPDPDTWPSFWFDGLHLPVLGYTPYYHITLLLFIVYLLLELRRYLNDEIMILEEYGRPFYNTVLGPYIRTASWSVRYVLQNIGFFSFLTLVVAAIKYRDAILCKVDFSFVGRSVEKAQNVIGETSFSIHVPQRSIPRPSIPRPGLPDLPDLPNLPHIDLEIDFKPKIVLLGKILQLSGLLLAIYLLYHPIKVLVVGLWPAGAHGTRIRHSTTCPRENQKYSTGTTTVEIEVDGGYLDQSIPSVHTTPKSSQNHSTGNKFLSPASVDELPDDEFGDQENETFTRLDGEPCFEHPTSPTEYPVRNTFDLTELKNFGFAFIAFISTALVMYVVVCEWGLCVYPNLRNPICEEACLESSAWTAVYLVGIFLGTWMVTGVIEALKIEVPVGTRLVLRILTWIPAMLLTAFFFASYLPQPSSTSYLGRFKAYWFLRQYYPYLLAFGVFRHLKMLIHGISYFFWTKATMAPFEDRTFYPKDVTVIITPNSGASSTNAQLRDSVESVLKNFPRQIIISTSTLLDRRNTQLVVSTEFPSRNIRVIHTDNVSKRIQFLAASELVTTSLIAYVDSYTLWPARLLQTALDCLETKSVDVVSTISTIPLQYDSDSLGNFAKFLKYSSIRSTNFHNTATNNIDGGISSVSKYTSIFPTSIVHSVDFRKKYLFEAWYLPGCQPLEVDTDDSELITRYMTANGRKVAIQNHPSATVTIQSTAAPITLTSTTKEELLHYRTMWRHTCMTLSRTSIWTYFPWTTYSIYLSFMFDFSILYDIFAYSALLDSTLGIDLRCGCAILFIFSNYVDQGLPRIEVMWDIPRIFYSIGWNYWLNLVKLYALFTVNNISVTDELDNVPAAPFVVKSFLPRRSTPAVRQQSSVFGREPESEAVWRSSDSGLTPDEIDERRAAYDQVASEEYEGWDNTGHDTPLRTHLQAHQEKTSAPFGFPPPL